MARQSINSEHVKSGSRRRWGLLSCLGCCPSRFSSEVDLFHAISKGDSERLEVCLKHLRNYPVRLTVRRGHPNKMMGTFYQECSPVIWAVECCQWHLLPLLSRYGYDFNRPQLCRRWTCFCRKQLRPNNSPYRRLWTKGQYTYQSILDYFFASVYEYLGEFEDNPLLQDSDFLENSLQPLLFRTERLFANGVDVHRIDSIIIFNSLAASFDRYLCNYFDPDDELLPDIPKRSDAFVEMEVLQRLIENGFSEFEFMEYVSPNTNWFGILICLLAHPQLSKLVETNRTAPPLLRSAAVLFVNLLVWMQHSKHSSTDLRDSVNNLRLRKTYVRRYADQRTVFTSRVAGVIRESTNLLRSPPSLGLLARNKIRGLLGGKNFKAKVASLGLPQNLTSFLTAISTEHMTWIRAPPFTIAMANGKLTAASFKELEGGLEVELEVTPPPSPPLPRRPLQQLTTVEAVVQSPDNAESTPSPESPIRQGVIKRRASACPRISRLQPMTGPVLRIQRSMTAVVRGPRPSSAPLLKVTHRFQMPVR